MKINIKWILSLLFCYLFCRGTPPYLRLIFLSSWSFVNASVFVFRHPVAPLRVCFWLFLYLLAFLFAFALALCFFCVFSFQFKQSSPLGRPLCFCLIIHVCFSSVFLGFLFLVYFVFLVCLCSLCICVFSPQPKSRHRVPRPLLVPQSSHCCPHRGNCKEENQNEIS